MVIIRLLRKIYVYWFQFLVDVNSKSPRHSSLIITSLVATSWMLLFYYALNDICFPGFRMNKIIVAPVFMCVLLLVGILVPWGKEDSLSIEFSSRKLKNVYGYISIGSVLAPIIYALLRSVVRG